MTDIREILTELESTKKIYDIYVPSLQKDIKIKELNAESQKMLLASSVDSPFYTSLFHQALAKAIFNNIEDIDFNTEVLTTIDKAAIALQLRYYNLNQKIKIGDKEHNLKPLISDLKKIKHPEPLEVKNEEKALSVTLDVPTIFRELEVLNAISDHDTNVKDMSKFRQAIANIYVGELLKTIKVVHFRNKTYNLQELTIDDQLLLVNAFSIDVTKRVIEYTENVKNIIDGIFTLKGKGKDKEDVIVKYDASLFGTL